MKNIFVVRGLSFFVVLAICTAFAANRNAALAANLLAHSRLPVSVADIPEAAALRTAPRIALVVGNDHYKQWPSLRQPTADAGAMARSLYARGFELVGGGPQLDVSSDRFHQLLADTAAAVRANPGAIVVTYFSGHGFAANGASYLVPTDAPPESRAVSRSISVVQIARELHAAGSGLTIMFLDACREYEPGRGGLVEEKVPDDTFVGFATMFGTFAHEPPASGDNGHSYYTAALLRGLDAGSDRLEDLQLDVAANVVTATKGSQVPIYEEGARMPTAPVRLAENDPQSAYALARRRGLAESDILAARCDAMSDLRLIGGLAAAGNTNPDRLGLKIGPLYEPIDLPIMERACAAAYAAGHREPAVLRGLAFAKILATTLHRESPTLSTATKAFTLLAQASDAGDALADFALASLPTSPATMGYMGLQPDAIRERLVQAAERNDAPITGLVGIMLWAPQGAQFRDQIGLPEDKKLGLELFRRAVMAGDPLVQAVAFSLKLKKDPAVENLDLREGLHRALRSSSDFGFHFIGFSVHQSLYLFALLDVAGGFYGPTDPAELVRLTLEAEPFLAGMGKVYVQATGNKNAADGFFTMAACILASGRDQSGKPVPGIIPNRWMALQLLKQVSDNPPPEIRENLFRLAHGGTCR